MSNALYLGNDYLGSSVHRRLVESLIPNGVDPSVFVAYKNHSDAARKKLEEEPPDYPVLFSRPQRPHHRFLFRTKINFLYRDLNKQMDLNKVDVVHASTLYSDGGLAYKIHRRYGTPYVVAVRATDIHVFMRLRPDLAPLARSILKKARKIIFISPMLMSQFVSHPTIKPILDRIKDKLELVLNGIDDYWLDNRGPKRPMESPAQITYVGRLLHRKNVLLVAEMVVELNRNGIPCEFNIVGYGPESEKVKEFAGKHPDCIRFLGRITGKEELGQHYRNNHIFAMPSAGETFGLVYIEALSQGLPVLYTRHEGIDGVFEEPIGESCLRLYEEIYAGLEKLITQYNQYPIESLELDRFRWSNIGKRYALMYRLVV